MSDRVSRCGGYGPLAERIVGFLLNGEFFRCDHSLRRADRSMSWILSFNQLSRAYSFLALAFALAPALGCRCDCIVLILCGLFFIAG